VITFPADIKPLISQGYTFSSPDNLLSSEVSGSVNEAQRRFKYGLVSFSIGLSVNDEGLTTFKQFYTTELSSGSGKFMMPLDSGNGIEETPVFIVPGSVSYDLTENPKNRISFEVVAERTTFQNNPYQGIIVDIYEEFGPDFVDLLNALEIFVFEVLPE